MVVARSVGEILAQCDKEEATSLAINLANDIATGAKKVKETSYYCKQAIKIVLYGQMDLYLQKLHFTPGGNTEFTDWSTPGM